MLLGRLVLSVSGLVWLGIGVWALCDPVAVAASVQLQVPTPLGRLEIRAMYGGLGVMLGLVHGLALRRPELVLPGVVATGMASAGLALGRIISLLVDDAPAPVAYLFLASELALVAVAGFAAWRLARQPARAT